MRAALMLREAYKARENSSRIGASKEVLAEKGVREREALLPSSYNFWVWKLFKEKVWDRWRAFKNKCQLVYGRSRLN